MVFCKKDFNIEHNLDIWLALFEFLQEFWIVFSQVRQ